MDIKNINWQKCGGLIPAITQDFETSEVLMLGYMSEESLDLSLKTGLAHYFSRSRNRIWQKGETSGNTQDIKEILLDCDADTILLKVKQNGVACHTGEKSCFFTKFEGLNLVKQISNNTQKPKYDILDELYHTIEDRKLNANPENSHVARLFAKGENAILKKICEEAGEVMLACKDQSKFEKYKHLNLEEFGEHKPGDPKFDIIYEASDLVFHLLVALNAHNIHPQAILDELARRNGISGIDEKKSRKDKFQ
ncbi:bifunctional phosphoribosyl-AMP cyclohydrolase/phosphoribosyl-ATP diphosphatase HisIE [Campylobacter ureolyticus]|uniref:bifunctional phosphoribosyl-AMP cyclohydrolase/phosphoribosyl-ATP diphosphatase HisIE n=1 Tax=Campylobacter ureolyticus TaxID=827 RepID=UPI0022B519E9|nr:bifunctional phosphoribosyl-AMP cyclohydrolase/phosphoribosyl-ATP diphosphatase HisIE [Campylobacter ureolyticus]MCZ6117240.1 bifunctional phosphoribosyl-AMP cyclohydrolase/phosphoribosyl-ATP diphosphatase HisIE [Campylobacter ureolyticus]